MPWWSLTKKKKLGRGGPNYLSTANRRADVHVSAQACVQPFCCGISAGMGTGSLLNSSVSWAEDLCLLSCSPVNNLNYLKIQESRMSLCLNFSLKILDPFDLEWHKASRRLQPIQRWRFHCRQTYTAQVCTETLGDSLYLYLPRLCRYIFPYGLLFNASLIHTFSYLSFLRLNSLVVIRSGEKQR